VQDVFQDEGARLALTTAATPVPLRPTGEPFTATFAVIVRVWFTVPAAVGEKTTLMVQFEPAARVVPQVPPADPAGRAKVGDEKARAMPVAPALPEFWSVSVRDELVVPVTTLPKASGPPVTVSTAEAGPLNSTAPMSTDPLVFLGFSK
jgi:hypothetical protein